MKLSWMSAVQLQESWCREMQVLPARTHPTMTTSGTGGYILSAIRVRNTPQPESLSKGASRQGRPGKKRKVRV